jgi:hypothetical protein
LYFWVFIAEEAEVDLYPRVLVASNDDARAVGIEEENRGIRGRFLKEVVLDGEV